VRGRALRAAERLAPGDPQVTDMLEGEDGQALDRDGHPGFSVDDDVDVDHRLGRQAGDGRAAHVLDRSRRVAEGGFEPGPQLDEDLGPPGSHGSTTTVSRSRRG
jgi:hypothetical protein